MVLEGKCRIIIQNGNRPKKVLVYIPLEIARDSQFPYKKSCEAQINVKPDGTIIITRS